MSISVIVPCLNEASNLANCLTSVRAHLPGCELIVVDGNSDDGSEKIAELYADQVIRTSPGRGAQCRLAASVAAGELLIFLHADCKLSPGALATVSAAFANPKMMVGTFRVKFDAPGRSYRFLEFCSRFDTLVTTFGDQGLLVRKQHYLQLGGIPALALFEDVAFFRQARRHGRIIKLPSQILTSARRFERLGFWRTHMINTWLIFGYLLGIKAERLQRVYYACRR